MADAYNANLPEDDDYARFAASELRAIKARMDAMVGVNLNGVLSFRNLAINPEFKIDQFNEGAAYTVTGNDLDGWVGTMAGGGTFSRIRDLSADGTNSRLVTITVADGAIAAGDFYASISAIEGPWCLGLFQGQSKATGLTISFDVTASIAGNYAIAVRNNTTNRSYVTTFNVAVAGTEQSIVVQIPGDTTGAWATTLGAVGLYVSFDHGSGSNFVAPLLNQWQAGNFVAAAGTVQLIATAAATFRLRNFSVQANMVASPVFERPPFDMQLRYAQRYAEKSFNQGVAVAANAGTEGAMTCMAGVGAAVIGRYPTVYYKEPKRINVPIITMYNTGAAGNQIRNLSGGTNYTLTSVFMTGMNGFSIQGTSPAGTTAENAIAVQWYSDARM